MILTTISTSMRCLGHAVQLVIKAANSGIRVNTGKPLQIALVFVRPHCLLPLSLSPSFVILTVPLVQPLVIQ